MCTIGAVALNDKEYILFKNKDFARPEYEDQVVINEDWFGPLGLETFAEDPMIPNVYSGISIGANRHGLLCCVDHVKITDDSRHNYDLLTQVALSEGHDVLSAIHALKHHVKEQPSWWGNLILADKQQLAAVEVRDDQIRIESNTARIFRTNHQLLFGESRSNDGVDCSADRYQFAMNRLIHVSSIEDIFKFLSSHDNGETGICNHGAKLSTVYSYVLHHKNGDTTLHLTHGHPCANKWKALHVPIGAYWSPDHADTFIRAYPGATRA